jgi:hypothetical protein
MKVLILALTILSFVSRSSAFGISVSSNHPRAGCSKYSMLQMSSSDVDRRSFVTTAASVASLASFGLTSLPAPSEAASQMWKQVKVPFEDTLYDLDFDR